MQTEIAPILREGWMISSLEKELSEGQVEHLNPQNLPSKLPHLLITKLLSLFRVKLKQKWGQKILQSSVLALKFRQ